MSVPEQWTNQKSAEAEQALPAFVYSSNSSFILWQHGGGGILCCDFLKKNIPELSVSRF